MVGDDPAESLDDRAAGLDDPFVRDARSVRDGLWHAGQVSRPTRFPGPGPLPAARSRARIGRWSDGVCGEHLARQHGDVVSHENVVDLAVRPVRGIGRPSTARSPRRQHRDRRPAPRSCSRPRRRLAARGRKLRPQRNADDATARASRAATTCARRRCRPRRPSRRPCSSNACRRPAGSRADRSDRELAPLATTGKREQIASSHVPFTGIFVAARAGC